MNALPFTPGYLCNVCGELLARGGVVFITYELRSAWNGRAWVYWRTCEHHDVMTVPTDLLYYYQRTANQTTPTP